MEYTVKIFFNGIHWDESYTHSIEDAEEWKALFEDKNHSIWDRVNQDALEEFIREYDIEDIENIEVTAEIVEG